MVAVVVEVVLLLWMAEDGLPGGVFVVVVAVAFPLAPRNVDSN